MKDLKDVALFLKNNIVCDIPDTYDISDVLTGGLNDTDIRSGVKGFRSLLHLLFDTLIEHKNDYDTLNKTDKNTIALEKNFPDLIYPIFMLYCIGLRGNLDNNTGCIMIDGNDLHTAFKDIHGSKPNHYLSFLSDLGLVFSIADITDKSFKLNKAGMIEIQYPDFKHTLTGLKILAEATSRTGKSYKDKAAIISVFARCDYHSLALPKKFSIDIKDLACTMRDEYKDFFIHLHKFLNEKNCKYESKYQMNEFIFTYTSKISKTVVFSVHITIDECYVKLNSKLINEQPSLLSDAPDGIIQAVKNGFNCAKLWDPNACNPKCTNLRFVIDGTEYQKCRCLNFNLPIDANPEREFIKVWLDRELASN